MELSEEQYLTERLDHQIKWYNSRSIKQQRIFKRLKRLEVIMATLIPLLSGVASVRPYIPFVIGSLGGLVAIVESFLNVSKYHENWIEYRSICETLKHEKYLFLTHTGVYNDTGRFNVLVERVENVISKENVNWMSLNTSTKQGTNNK